MTDTMTVQQIAERLTALHTALVEKLGAQPWMEPRLEINQSAKAGIGFYGPKLGACRFATASGNTIAGCLDAADAVVAAMPDAATRQMHEFMEQLGKLIDSGREKGIPVEFVNPLEATMKRLASNALTHQPEQVTA